MKKQIIEEMARTMCGEMEQTCEKCNSGLLCEFWMEAQALYTAGYRKQKEGEWIKDEKSRFEHRYYCSACNFYLFGAPTNYCEECGAKMKGENNE